MAHTVLGGRYVKTQLCSLVITSCAMITVGEASAGNAVTVKPQGALTSTPQVTPLADADITMDLEKLIRVQRAPECARYVSAKPIAIVELSQATPQLNLALRGARGILVKPEHEFIFWSECRPTGDEWARITKTDKGWPAGRYEVYAASNDRADHAQHVAIALSDPNNITPAEAAATKQREDEAEKARRPKPHFVSVMDRFPDVTDADSINLDKVKDVIGKSTADMWYSVGECPHDSSYFPVPGGTGPDPDMVGVEDQIGTDAHPYAEVWTAAGELRLGVRTQKLAPSTPVLVWQEDIKEGRLIVMTADGGRYRINGTPYSGGTHEFRCGTTPMLVAGIHAPFPAPLQAVALSSKQIVALEQLGFLMAGLSKKIETARAAGSACTEALWKHKFEARDNANVVANITASTRANRREQILADYSAAIPGSCASVKKAFDTAFEKAIDANKKRRLELYQTVSPKLEQLAH
jgi:hypothetical protein